MPNEETDSMSQAPAKADEREVREEAVRSTEEEGGECIFCKIASGEMPAEVVYHDQELLAFYDIHPKAPVHILVIPRQHIPSLADLEKGDQVLVGTMLWVAKYLAESHRIAESGYRVVFNTGAGAGQVVPHLHLHLLGGQQMNEDDVM